MIHYEERNKLDSEYYELKGDNINIIIIKVCFPRSV